MSVATTSLHRHLGYHFHQPLLLEQALTHRSAVGPNNERLEFLGDAILNLVISTELFKVCPKADEGELSRLRSSLVKGETLARLARELGIGDFLRLGSGELKSGGHRRDSILADALEAIFGAVYLDGGLESGRQLILRLYQDLLEQLPPTEELKDPKTRLQEYLQGRQLALPVYTVLAVTGEAHAQSFTVECSVDELRTVAVGTSRRKAEQEAARQALALIHG